MMVIVKSGLPTAIDVGEVDEMTIDEFPPGGFEEPPPPLCWEPGIEDPQLRVRDIVTKTDETLRKFMGPPFQRATEHFALKQFTGRVSNVLQFEVVGEKSRLHPLQAGSGVLSDFNSYAGGGGLGLGFSETARVEYSHARGTVDRRRFSYRWRPSLSGSLRFSCASATPRAISRISVFTSLL